eukprot:SAG31_NODE_7615_length_1640_cov_1.562622_1_plen_64_part_00
MSRELWRAHQKQHMSDRYSCMGLSIYDGAREPPIQAVEPGRTVVSLCYGSTLLLRVAALIKQL